MRKILIILLIIWENNLQSNEISTNMDMCVDNDFTYIANIFKGQQTFDGTTYTSNGDYDILLIKSDKDGNILWVRQIGSSGLDLSRGISVYGNYVYINGDIGEKYIGQPLQK